jgi:hypothetical protein
VDSFPEKQARPKAASETAVLVLGANLGNYKSLQAKLPIKILPQSKSPCCWQKTAKPVVITGRNDIEYVRRVANRVYEENSYAVR